MTKRRTLLVVFSLMLVATLLVFAACDKTPEEQPATLSSISVSGSVEGKLTGEVLEIADLSGIVVKATFSDGTETQIALANLSQLPQSLTVDKLNQPLASGSNVVTFSYTVEGVTVMAQLTVVATDKPVFTVSFATGNGSSVQSQRVEEGSKAVKPTDPTLQGYTFDKWLLGQSEFDFNTPITADVQLEAVYTANTDTAYAVEHYFEQLDGSFVKDESKTESKQGTTDTTATASALTVEHYSLDSANASAVASGNIAGDGSLKLALYYVLDTFEVTLTDVIGSQDYSQTVRGVKYGTSASVLYSQYLPEHEGYTFLGWFADSYKIAESDTVTASIAVTAQYQANTYYITYFDGEMKSVQSVIYGEDFTLAQLPDGTTYSTCLGWYNGDEKLEDGKWAIAHDVAVSVRWQIKSWDFEDGQNNIIGVYLRGGATQGTESRTLEVTDLPQAAGTGKALKVVTVNQDKGNTAILKAYFNDVFANPFVEALALDIYAETHVNGESLDIRFSTNAGHSDNNYRYVNQAAGTWKTYYYTREMYAKGAPASTGDYYSLFFNRYTDTFYIDNIRAVGEGFYDEFSLAVDRFVSEKTSALGANATGGVAYRADGTPLFLLFDGSSPKLSMANAQTADLPQGLAELIGEQNVVCVKNSAYSSFKLAVNGDYIRMLAMDKNVLGFAFDVFTVDRHAQEGMLAYKMQQIDKSEYENNRDAYQWVFANAGDEFPREENDKFLAYKLDALGNKIVDCIGLRTYNNKSSAIYVQDVEGACTEWSNSSGNTGYMLADGKATVTIWLSDYNNANYFMFFIQANAGDYYFFNFRPVYADKATVSFDVNGGEPIAEQQVALNGKLQLPTAVRSGYTFDGWFIGDVEITAELAQQITVGRDMKLTAHWTANKYSLSFVGEDDSPMGEAQQVTFGEAINCIPSLEGKEREGYTVAWTVNGQKIENGNTWAIAQDSVAKLTYTPVDCTLTIKYECEGVSVKEQAQQTVKFDAEFSIEAPAIVGYQFAQGQSATVSGKMDSVSGKTITINYSAKVYEYEIFVDGPETEYSPISVTYNKAIGSQLEAKTIQDWKFVRFYVISGDNEVEINAEYVWLFDDSEMLVVAEYKQTGSVVINCMLQGTSTVIKTVNKEVEVGTEYAFDFETISGYTLADGNTAIAGTMADVNGATFNVYYTANAYTITYDANGGTVESATQQVTYGQAFTLAVPTYSNNYTEFVGWYDGETLVTNETVITSDINLKAKWNVKPYVPFVQGFEDSSQTEAYKITTNTSGDNMKDVFGVYINSGLGENGTVYFRYSKVGSSTGGAGTASDYLKIFAQEGNFHIRYTNYVKSGDGKLMMTYELAKKLFADDRTTHIAFDVMINNEGSKVARSPYYVGGSYNQELAVGVWTTLYIPRSEFEKLTEGTNFVMFAIPKDATKTDANVSLDNIRSVRIDENDGIELQGLIGVNHIDGKVPAARMSVSSEVAKAGGSSLKVQFVAHDNGWLEVDYDAIAALFSDSTVTGIKFDVYVSEIDTTRTYDNSGADLRFYTATSNPGGGNRINNGTLTPTGKWTTVTYTRTMFETMSQTGTYTGSTMKFLFSRWEDTFYLDNFQVVKAQ